MSTSDAAVLAMYETQQGRAAARAVALAEYRCAGQGCLLLHLWRSPQGVMFYRPAYKLSLGRNESESTPDGRAANTTDGRNHWRADAGTLESARGWEGHAMPVQCDHFQGNVSTADLFADADAATPGKPRRRRLPLDDW